MNLDLQIAERFDCYIVHTIGGGAGFDDGIEDDEPLAVGAVERRATARVTISMPLEPGPNRSIRVCFLYLASFSRLLACCWLADEREGAAMHKQQQQQ
jgi:hypothetical protein